MGFAYLCKGTGSLGGKTLIVVLNLQSLKLLQMKSTVYQVILPLFALQKSALYLTEDTHHTEIILPVDA